MRVLATSFGAAPASASFDLAAPDIFLLYGVEVLLGGFSGWQHAHRTQLGHDGARPRSASPDAHGRPAASVGAASADGIKGIDRADLLPQQAHLAVRLGDEDPRRARLRGARQEVPRS